MALSVIYNTAQKRVAFDRLAITGAGLDFATNVYYSDTYIDPITKTLMLMPSMFDPDFYTLNTGSFAKLGLSAFGLASDPDWVESYDQEAAGPWLCLKDSADNQTAISTASYGLNRGMIFAWFNYGAGEDFEKARFGWSDSGDLNSGVGCIVYASGFVRVYRDGVEVGNGKVTGRQTTQSNPNRFFRIMLVPCRRRELLIISSQGDGFSVVFGDIADDEAAPEITPDEKFWFRVVKGGTMVQISPLFFASSGHACTFEQSLIEPPGPGEALEEFENDATWLDDPAPYKILGQPPFVSGVDATAEASLVEIDGVTPFVPDGVEKTVRIRADLSSDNTGYSPFVYSAYLAYPEVIVDTDETEAFDITSQIVSASLSVPEDPRGVVFDIEVKDPTALETDVAKFRKIGNAPVQVKIGDIILIDGVASPPEIEYTMNGEADRAQIEISDFFSILENHQFSDKVPFDDQNFSEVIESLLRRVGFEAATTNVSTTTLLLSNNESRECGEYSNEAKRGELLADILTNLFKTFAANWWWGIRPTATVPEFYATKPDDLETVPTYTLYETHDDAIAAGKTEEEASSYVYKTWRTQQLEPLANQVRITGEDPRTKEPFQVFKEDADSIDPTIAPSLRADNWIGGIRRDVQASRAITNEQLATEVCEAIYDVVTKARLLCGFKSDFLLDEFGIPLWRGAVIQMEGKAEGLWRINSFRVTFMLEETTETPNEDPEGDPIITYLIRRSAEYTAEYIGPIPEEEE